MNLKLLCVLIVLCLPACGTPSVRDDSPESDLTALVTSVKRDLQRRVLPNGKEYCAELAKTEDAQDDCMGDLEDVVYLSNRDKDRAANTLTKGMERIKLSRQPCGFFDLGCKRRARALDAPGR